MENAENDRLILFPIQKTALWDLYKEAEASFWTAEEIDLASDRKDFERMTENEQYFIKMVLAFFASADAIVSENLAMRFYQEIPFPEARAFYAYQSFIEHIHGETYALLIQNLISDSAEQRRLFRAIETVPCVTKKNEWALKWISSARPLSDRLIAFACVEGIFFSGSFASIFWLKKRGLMPGVTFSNELISRDEGQHTRFACALLKDPDFIAKFGATDETTAATIVREAVELELEFVTESLPVRLLGMNADLMSEYIRFVADYLLALMGYSKIYQAAQPFDWMENISLQGKTNFFERRVSEYQKAGVTSGLPRAQLDPSAFADQDF